jgi:hypothetical protein
VHKNIAPKIIKSVGNNHSTQSNDVHGKKKVFQEACSQIHLSLILFDYNLIHELAKECFLRSTQIH